jgi:acetylornithine deacetylase/succinyl-diaminopimelate desuccinylase-like protein
VSVRGAEAAEWVAAAFAAEGFADARLVPTPDGSQAVIGSRPCGLPGAPTVLLYAHYDVPPPLDEQAWHTPPFELTEVGGAGTAAAQPTARATSSGPRSRSACAAR